MATTVLVRTGWKLTYTDGHYREVITVIANTLEDAQELATSYFACLYGKDSSQLLAYMSATTFDVIEQPQ